MSCYSDTGVALIAKCRGSLGKSKLVTTCVRHLLDRVKFYGAVHRTANCANVTYIGLKGELRERSRTLNGVEALIPGGCVILCRRYNCGGDSMELVAALLSAVVKVAGWVR